MLFVYRPCAPCAATDALRGVTVLLIVIVVLVALGIPAPSAVSVAAAAALWSLRVVTLTRAAADGAPR